MGRRIKVNKRKSSDPSLRPSLKRTLEDIETDLETAERTAKEWEGRAKRLRQEKTNHPDAVRKRAAAARNRMQYILPPYLFEALVASPSPTYGALENFDISWEHHSREIKDGIYTSELSIDLCFERRSICFTCDTDNGMAESHHIVWPKKTETMTQQELWTQALALNNNDVGLAFIVVCYDAWVLVDDFEEMFEYDDCCLAIEEVEVLRRLRAKVGHLTTEELTEFYGLRLTDWLTKGVDLTKVDMDAQVRRVNKTKNIWAEFQGGDGKK